MIEKPNFEIIDNLSNGDAEVKKMILDVLIEEFPAEQEIYFNYFKSKNYLKLKEIVHKLKNKISILGLEKSYESANNYEKQLTNNSTKGSEEFDLILENISNFIKTL